MRRLVPKTTTVTVVEDSPGEVHDAGRVLKFQWDLYHAIAVMEAEGQSVSVQYSHVVNPSGGRFHSALVIGTLPTIIDDEPIEPVKSVVYNCVDCDCGHHECHKGES